MDDSFRHKVRAAASAAWWTLLIGAVFLTVQWVGYLVIMSAKPAWALSLWGPDATWDTIRMVWFDALVVAKLTLWPVVLVAVWLTLWARRLGTR
jgi:hypothetical protein